MTVIFGINLAIISLFWMLLCNANLYHFNGNSGNFFWAIFGVAAKEVLYNVSSGVKPGQSSPGHKQRPSTTLHPVSRVVQSRISRWNSPAPCSIQASESDSASLPWARAWGAGLIKWFELRRIVQTCFAIRRSSKMQASAIRQFGNSVMGAKQTQRIGKGAC